MSDNGGNMNNLRIRVRLILIFGVFFVALVAASIISFSGMNILAANTKSLYEHPMAVTNAILAADGHIVRMHRSMKDVVLSRTPEQLDSAVAAVDRNEKLVYEDMKLVKEGFLGDPKMVEDILRPIGEWKPIRDRVIALQRDGKPEEASDITRTEGAAKVAAINEAVNILKAWATQKGKSFFEDSESTRDRLITIFITVDVVAVLLALIVGIVISNGIIEPLNEAVRVARTVAAGDLTSRIEVKSKDETGLLLQALKDMNDNLVGTVGGIRAASESVAGAAAQIASGNLDLSSRTEQQAASLEQTAASMSEMTETIKQNADNARQANLLAIDARGMAQSGRADVEAMVQTVGEVSADSVKVAEITGMIEGIAFQTNILALNAAVEAARAGEQGRAFAVVAGEVRSLAQRASTAAREIKDLIEASTTKVQASARQAAGVNAAMERVSVGIERVSDLIGEISATSDEQSRNIEQLHQAVNQIDQVTQQNAALVEESAAAAQSLQEQAVGMKKDVMFFKIGANPASLRSIIAH